MGHIEFCVVQVKIHFFFGQLYCVSKIRYFKYESCQKCILFFSLPKLQTPELGREQFFLILIICPTRQVLVAKFLPKKMLPICFIE